MQHHLLSHSPDSVESSPSAGSPLLEVRSLVKYFHHKGQKVKAVDSISFSVQAGEVFAFLGPNGSGKTTTLNMISGLIAPDNGSILLQNKKPGEPSYLQGVAFLSGDSRFLWSFTGIEILRFYAELHRVPWRQVEALLDAHEMREKAKRSWERLSNGEKARLRLIRVLLRSPSILFLDEPTAGLDPDAASHVRTSLAQLNEEGMTIVLTSHYMKDIEALADRICFIRNGKIAALGQVHEFTHVEDKVEIEFHDIPARAIELGEVRGNTLYTSTANLQQAVALSSVKSIRTLQQSLEEYFILLSRDRAHSSTLDESNRP